MTAEMTATQLLGGAALAFGVYLVLWAAGRHLKRRHNVRFGAGYVVFCLVAAAFVTVQALRITHPFPRELLAALVLLGAWVSVGFLRRFVWERFFREGGRTDAPRMLREVVSILILAGALLLVLRQIYGIAIPGLLAGSGIAAVVLGLAMQDVLSNIISGFALHFEKPFRIGDWLDYNGQYAQVLELNWRSTRLLTNDQVTLDIPNRELARMTIVNLHAPEPRHAMRLTIGVEHDAPPSAVKDALLRAATGAPGVLASPEPVVFLKDFGDRAIVYEIKFWIDDQGDFNPITDAIRSNAWYELRRAGIRIPVSPSTVYLERGRPRARGIDPDTLREALCDQPLFASLDDEERETLLEGSRVVWFGRGEKVIRQDEPGESMFILLHGGARVVVDRGHGPKPVATLRAGDCFGEMSLLTGEARTATLVAREDCEALEITKEAMGNVLRHNPALSLRFGELLAQRQMETEGRLHEAEEADAQAESRRTEYAEGFLQKLRVFFEL